MRYSVSVLAAAAALPLASAKTFRFIALGDWGMGGLPAGNAAEVLSARCYHDVTAEFDSQFTINVGDQLYMTDVRDGLDKSWRQTWKKKGSHGGGMWMCARGNHDNFGPQVSFTRDAPDTWWFPNVYWTRTMDTNQGYKIQVWSLDSNGGGSDNRWLENTLSQSTARWKFFTTHFPFANSGRHKRVGPPIHMAGIAKKFGVQIMFQGHDHIVQVCMHQGVAFVTTGATSRGAMMARPIDEDKTKFVFTMGVKTSVGQHGITQFEVTKYVLWGSVHAHGSMVYEFNTVWDWPLVYGRTRNRPKTGNPDAGLPPRRILMQYLQEEAEELAGGKSSGGEPVAATPAPPPTPAPTNAVDTSASADAEKLKKEKEEQAQAVITQIESMPTPPPVSTDPIKAARYVVGAECKKCLGPSMKNPFTIWIQGATLTSKHKMFLAFTEAACRAGDLEQALGGKAAVRDLTEPVQRYNPQGELPSPSPVFVCGSSDGQTYFPIPQADSGVTGFTLYPEPPPSPNLPPSVQKLTVHANEGYYRPGVAHLTPSPPAVDEGLSSSTMLMGGMLLVCVPVAWYLGKQNGRQEQ
eukprot:TRINITY_DN43621_c0_g1_i1.p1 TRINITY_DN43621_c0_g1~~TRINITY_DN43621_c0_g1_i1.p1  ORF type:complete len:578 (+),score=143.00 TRINITY_DN43621_c0_g1_i1:170-1903(+)